MTLALPFFRHLFLVIIDSVISIKSCKDDKVFNILLMVSLAHKVAIVSADQPYIRYNSGIIVYYIIERIL